MRRRLVKGPALESWLVVALSIVLTSCVGGSVAGVGETPTPEQRVPASGRQLVVAVVDQTGSPLPGATVTFTDEAGSQAVVSDADGQAAFSWSQGPVSITAEAPGLVPREAVVVERPEEIFSLALHPVVLRGKVVDPAGYPLSGAFVSSATSEATSGPDGSFELARATPGDVVVRRAARATVRERWDGESAPIELVMPPLVVRAIHVDAAAAANPSAWSDLLQLADSTVVDGFVVDIKDDTGRVFYDSSNDIAGQVGAVMEWFRLVDITSDLEDHGLYGIARLVAFVDPLAPRARPSMAVWDQRRDAPYVGNSLWYLDPTDTEARSYVIDLALEVCRAGFDEIQFDHVAFPLTSDGSLVFDEAESESDRSSAIRSFMAEAATRLAREGCATAVDVLGSTMTVEAPGAAGQDFPALSQVADVLAPTVYPSHYSEGWFGLEDPSSRPGRVVARALDDGVERLAGPAVIRPWLQDFAYGAQEVKAQIAAAEQRGLGWMLWNGQSMYTISAIETASEEEPEA